MSKKLHLCCGDVYLEGYVNIDKKGCHISTVKENPNATNLNNYYKSKFDANRENRIRGNYVVDKFMNILSFPWDFSTDSIEEVVMISAIEHFKKSEAENIIKEIKRVLIPGGRLIIDFPNIKEDIELYYNTNPEFCFELIYCNQSDSESCHRWGYNEISFKQLLGEGWESIEYKTIVKHDYPMIGCIAVKGNV